jgi:hypothetical protein
VTEDEPRWRVAPGGLVLRWWTGTAWGPDVAELGTSPDPPPVWRREIPHGPLTQPVGVPAQTRVLAWPGSAGPPRR